MMDDYDTGLGTTPGMWDMLSELLEEYEAHLPDSLNNAIYALRDGSAKVINGEYICSKCGLRQKLGIKPDCEF